MSDSMLSTWDNGKHLNEAIFLSLASAALSNVASLWSLATNSLSRSTCDRCIHFLSLYQRKDGIRPNPKMLSLPVETEEKRPAAQDHSVACSNLLQYPPHDPSPSLCYKIYHIITNHAMEIYPGIPLLTHKLRVAIVRLRTQPTEIHTMQLSHPLFSNPAVNSSCTVGGSVGLCLLHMVWTFKF